MTLHEDMLGWLHRNGSPEAVEVIRYEEDQRYGVSCGEGTCWDDYTVVEIYYLDSNGQQDYDWYEGELTEFIKELTN